MGRLLHKQHLVQLNGFQVNVLKERLNLQRGRATEQAVQSNFKEVERAAGCKVKQWGKSNGSMRQGDKVGSYDMTLGRRICIVLSSVKYVLGELAWIVLSILS